MRMISVLGLRIIAISHEEHTHYDTEEILPVEPPRTESELLLRVYMCDAGPAVHTLTIPSVTQEIV